MTDEKLKVNRYEVYMGNASTIIPANRCVIFQERLIFISASNEEVAMFNLNEIQDINCLMLRSCNLPTKSHLNML